jgi:hypothetical protein
MISYNCLYMMHITVNNRPKKIHFSENVRNRTMNVRNRTLPETVFLDRLFVVSILTVWYSFCTYIGNCIIKLY